MTIVLGNIAHEVNPPATSRLNGLLLNSFKGGRAKEALEEPGSRNITRTTTAELKRSHSLIAPIEPPEVTSRCQNLAANEFLLWYAPQSSKQQSHTKWIFQPRSFITLKSDIEEKKLASF